MFIFKRVLRVGCEYQNKIPIYYQIESLLLIGSGLVSINH